MPGHAWRWRRGCPMGFFLPAPQPARFHVLPACLCEKTNTSRETLNDYINYGLLLRPRISKIHGTRIRPRRLGYFPAAALDTVNQIKQLKRQDLSVDEIVGRLAASAPQPKWSVLGMPGAATLGDGRRTAGALAEGGDLTLTVVGVHSRGRGRGRTARVSLAPGRRHPNAPAPAAAGAHPAGGAGGGPAGLGAHLRRAAAG